MCARELADLQQREGKESARAQDAADQRADLVVGQLPEDAAGAAVESGGGGENGAGDVRGVARQVGSSEKAAGGIAEQNDPIRTYCLMDRVEVGDAAVEGVARGSSNLDDPPEPSWS